MIRAAALGTLTAVLLSQSPFAQEDSGKAPYTRVCEPCHGPDGKGGGQGPALVPFDIEVAELITIVRQGIGMMPAISRERVSDDEIARIRTYLVALSHAERSAPRAAPIRRRIPSASDRSARRELSGRQLSFERPSGVRQ